MSEEIEAMLLTAAKQAKAHKRWAEAGALFYASQGVRATSLLPVVQAALEEPFGSLLPMAQAAVEEHFGSPVIDNFYDLSNVLTFLASYGVDLNAGSGITPHYTPLMSFSFEGLVDLVERLVLLGADLNMTNEYGHTALFCSVMQGHYETMHFLLKAGATSEGVDNDNYNIWDMLIQWLEECQDVAHIQGEDLASQALLMEPLRILVVQTSIHPDQDVYLVQELLEPALSLVMIEGIALREQMPTYLRHRQAVLESRRSRMCSLPLELRELIYSFEGPFTAEEIWAAEDVHDAVIHKPQPPARAPLSSLLNTGSDDIQACPLSPTCVTVGIHAADRIIILSDVIPIFPIYSGFPWIGLDEPL